nr:hypothetical protein [Nocardia abscessus]
MLYLAFVGTWLVPFQVTMLTNYVLLTKLGLLNSLIGVVLPTLCSGLAVLLLRQHMASFPKELVAAAQIDLLAHPFGPSSCPTCAPALAALALAILLFIYAWNEYFWPAVVLRQSNSVLQLGLRSFMDTEGDQWGTDDGGSQPRLPAGAADVPAAATSHRQRVRAVGLK